ncbi:MAG: tetratricopeptide repeat protein [Chloroflexi bacterium]|nr:tetratricopeptide repeat protein [Chloroflexota bacterium]
MADQILANDLQELFHAGIERAGRHWLAFFRDRPADPDEWARLGGHALRALSWCADSGRYGELATDLVLALEWHVMYLGHWHEWESSLRHVSARLGETIDAERQILLGGRLATLCWRLGRSEEALALQQQDYELAVACGDARLQWGVLEGMAEAYLNARRFDQALRCAEQATGLAIAIGDLVEQAASLINAARALMELGEVPEVRRRLERALALAVAAGNIVFEAKARLFLGHAAVAAGDWALALARFREALPLVASYRDEVGRATVLSNIGRALTELGQWDEAAVALEEAIRVLRRHGNTPAETVVRQRLAALQARRS